jgi:hypothetical protein
LKAGFTIVRAASTLRLGATEITVEADPASPRLTRLCLDRRSCWTQKAPEGFIPTIQVGSDIKALQWKGNKNASLVTSRSVRFIHDVLS